ncbi:2Fe-2S iron-sulfur cluster binding domain-containing protein [Blastococcus sp. MG754426]|uniref:xanthine dehydrogenase family Fe-S subunit n=1 Tax=unclassified Blastococcus TaxID=2619396 RepID=UPI001EF126AE|nr:MULTISPECIES: 2Fe-2S iron-sulfur cluster-binding protein [unclassified Blastococcus]MCF6506600.1 2Fe-2S iron-sulfur cluster binding domain-containing protein [Blastococcus sp. MG754426]MCF6510310.1 2Fe-2S iron-sulfur cluster binding domain-containing protein [Blastococcus sp. MG754427]
MTTTEHQRAVKAAADELIDVSFTVNGTPVTIRVPARMHLADALRQHLGLTGTHLGCEHGVCGMCTVLVDGDAARACLVFAVQAEGTDVVTVEGLGTQDDQHPLQQAFSHHHALQCGFCTPGFLMSSYDLLTHEPGVDDERLPEELSGVICRCTGYRGILAAVADVAEAHPEGVPAPRNCAPRTLVGRGGAATAAAPEAAPVGDAEEAVPTDITRPTGTPTITVEVTRLLTSPLDDIWAVMTDVHRLARCLPGAEMTEDLGDDRYRGRATVALGPVRLAFRGLARITERDESLHRLALLAQGADTGGNRTAADIGLRATATPDGGTELRADAAVFLSGRIAQFGRALAGDVSQRMFEQFAHALDETARTGQPPDVGAGPGALSIGVAAVRDAVRRRLAAVRTTLQERRARRRGC